MDISIVIPVHNEAGNVRSVLSELAAVLARVGHYEVICVNDGSTDDTANELMAVRDSGYAHLRIHSHPRRAGQSAAIITGVRAARADWIVTLDGDGQNDPADIPRLLEVARSPQRSANLQLVSGRRAHRRDNIVKRLSSAVANGLRQLILHDGAPDTGCGLKAFSRQAFMELPRFDHMHRFLPALFRRNGGAVAMVDVNHRPRRRGVSKYGINNRLWVGIVDLLGVLWLLRRNQCAQSKELR